MATGMPRRVQVQVGVRRSAARAPVEPRMCVVGLAPRTGRWVSDRLPSAVVRAPNRDADGVAVEHLRLGPQDELGAVPGLMGGQPSLVRDAVQLALLAGAPAVDLLLLRAPGLAPHQLDRPEVLAALGSALPALPGVMVVVPDASGPAPVREGPLSDPEGRALRLGRLAAGLGPTLREAWQVGFLDVPPALFGQMPALLGGAAGQDLCLWAWQGEGAVVARHGWRSAAAAAAGLVARADDDLFLAKTRRSLPVGAGREVRARAAARAALPAPPGLVNALHLDAADGGDLARVGGELSLRAPAGEWGLAALRTVKLIHQRVLLAAEEFVFRPVHEAEAFALTAALDIVLRPFVSAGLLVGPGGDGAPEVFASVDRDASRPALVAELAASVRPWARGLRVRVGVDPGEAARVEVSA